MRHDARYASREDDMTELDVTSDIEAQLDELDPYRTALAQSDPEWDNEPMFDRNGPVRTKPRNGPVT
jgi:hypothetical protein